MEQAEQQEKEMRYGIKEELDFGKKALSISSSALIGKGSDKMLDKITLPYLIKPTMNAITGEAVPKIIDKVDEEIRQNIKE